MKTYSTRDVARILGLSPAQVRAHARAGLLTPERAAGNRYRFSFQDLVLLRATKALREARVPARRVRRALGSLLRQLPRGRSLSDVRIAALGHRVVVRSGDQLWQPESGQVVFDFAVAELASRAAPLATRRAKAARARERSYSAQDWFELAAELEVLAPDDARDAYRRVLELDPAHADAHVNLGRLLQEEGAREPALEHYRAALAAAPDHAVAAYNLGVALEGLGRRTEAAEAYERAIAADRTLADAHFNLARLYEQAGKQQAALRHLSKYRQLVRDDR
jgi:tetratricopeptide (TPR) repeat protein